MAHDRHSYVRFFPSDWLAGTARLSRPVRSVFFDICLYNWDHNRPAPKAEVWLMLDDMGSQGDQAIDQLVATGKLVRDENGDLYNPKALSEAQYAYEQWLKRVEGGRASGSSRRAKSSVGKSAEGTDQAEQEDSSNITRSNNQNQNQNQIIDATASISSGGSGKDVGDSGYDPEADDAAVEKIEAARQRAADISSGVEQIANAWNAMACKCGLSQIGRMDEKRVEAGRTLVAQYGTEAILEAISKIPESDFLLGGGEKGWKIKFAWFLDPVNFDKLRLGEYHQKVEDTPPPKPKPPIGRSDGDDPLIEKIREVLLQRVGQAAYDAHFSPHHIALEITDGRLLDVYFRSDLELEIYQTGNSALAPLALSKFGLATRLMVHKGS